MRTGSSVRSDGSALVSALAMGLVGVDYIDAHIGKHRHGIFDLLGGDFFRREHFVQLVVSDKAAGLRRLDQLLDRRIGHVEHGTVRSFGLRLLLILCFSCLGCHSITPKRDRIVSKRLALSLRIRLAINGDHR